MMLFLLHKMGIKFWQIQESNQITMHKFNQKFAPCYQYTKPSMDYTHLLNELNKANSFELYRLHVAIGYELENPKRILSIKQQLRIGAELSYFHYAKNKLVKAKLLEMRQKNVVVLDHEQNKRFIIPYYMLNIEGANVEIYENKNTNVLTANTLKVGDWVGFNNNGENIIGVIKRINGKTVTLTTNEGRQWRVAYSYLYRVHDGETNINVLLMQQENIHE